MSGMEAHRVDQARREAAAAAQRRMADKSATVDKRMDAKADERDVQQFRKLRGARRPDARQTTSRREASLREEAGDKQSSSDKPGARAQGATSAVLQSAVHRRESDDRAKDDGRQDDSAGRGFEGLYQTRGDAGVDSGAGAAVEGSGGGGGLHEAAAQIDRLCDQVLLADADMGRVKDLRLTLSPSLLPDTTLHVTRNPDGGLALNFESGAPGAVDFLQKHRAALAKRASGRSGMTVTVSVTARGAPEEAVS